MNNILKILSLTIVLIMVLVTTSRSQNAWINEIHYSDLGTDTNEFVEVVIQNPGNYMLSGFGVFLYNGNNGESYDTKTLDLFTAGATVNGFTIYYYMYPTNGIQNGEPDGIALAYNEVLIPGQFLSYEGAFQGVGGPADGIMSVDIGVLEGGEPDGSSLQLSGSGSFYSDFTWQPPAAETHGQENNDQDLMLVGIEIPDEVNFVLYPNPNSGKFTLVNPVQEIAKISVYSVFGQRVSELVLPFGENKISLDLASGLYFLVLSNQENTVLQVQKIIIN